MPTLANKVHDGPVFLSLLYMPELQIGQFTATEPASKQNRKDCTVSLALQRIWVRRLPEAASFFSCKPISEPHTQLLDALHTFDTGCQLGAEQASVGGFGGETPNGSESSVDRSCRELSVLEVNSVSGDQSC